MLLSDSVATGVSLRKCCQRVRLRWSTGVGWCEVECASCGRCRGSVPVLRVFKWNQSDDGGNHLQRPRVPGEGVW